MDKEVLCKIVRGFINDENLDENKYREFADKLYESLRSYINNSGVYSIIISPLVRAGALLISEQEKTHKDFWMGVYTEYCNEEMK